jgi:hypothetical protein
MKIMNVAWETRHLPEMVSQSMTGLCFSLPVLTQCDLNNFQAERERDEWPN